MSKKNTPIFIKTFISAYRDGLVKELGPQLWTTLQALATYMDKDGYCRPSQSKIAEQLGIRRETVHEHIKRLCAFRWRGKPILLKEAQKAKRAGYACHYRVMSESCLGIFKGQDAP
jgi:biotin operon repressor